MFMPPTTDIADQQDRALARLLELGLAAAEKVQARLMATEDDALLGDLSLALNRASRNVRQTIALQMRAARDRRADAREVEAEVRQGDEVRRSRHKTLVKTAVERLIWDEHERTDDEAERLVDLLDERVEEDALHEDFHAQPVAAHVARLCAELGVAGPDARAPDSPTPPRDDHDEHWRSSA